ncbi:MAG: hypothetical protein LBH32_12235 [Dysgonamonadaceae bacterium]|jgi:hypothetical protein|nr:hypothetical protein [Dysgonamonadaceae bacterium]
MKKLSFILVSLLFATSPLFAQDYARAGAALSAASEAYKSGDYRAALSSVADFEQAMGKATAYSHYLKIMSYYKLKDYENCKQQAAAYLKTAETDDDYAPEIRNIFSEL